MLTDSFYDGAFLYPEGDGWTLPGYFAPVENLRGAVRFTYRPFTILDKEVYLTLSGLTGVALSRKTAEVMAPRIKSWNIQIRGKDAAAAANVAPITVNSLLSLPPDLWTRFVALIIYGTHPSDTDPEWSKEDKDLHADSLVDSLIRGESIGDATVERLAKN